MKYLSAKRIQKVRVPAILLALSCAAFFLPVSAAPGWNTQEGSENTQGDQKKTGKNEADSEAPVYGAIGNPDDQYSMDIDGDGTADVTIPRADLIEVTVTPAVVVTINRQEAAPGETEEITSKSAEGVVENQNPYNGLKVSMTSLAAQDENAKQISVTDEPDQNKENSLSLSVYAKKSENNAFAMAGDGLGEQMISLANTVQDPAVPVTLGSLSPKNGSSPAGIYLLKADCRSPFVDKYKDLPITYQAVYKFTIQK